MAASKPAPAVSRAFVVALTGCTALWGCTTNVRDLAIARLSVANYDEWLSPPTPTGRGLLIVDLTTEMDLSEVLGQSGMLVDADVVFCGHPGDFVRLGYPLYTTSPRAGEAPRSLNGRLKGAEYSETTRKWTYYLPLNITTPGSLSIKGPGIGFDLRTNPEDICISLRNTPTLKWHRLRSNTLRISSDAIREALTDTHPADRPSDNR